MKKRNAWLSAVPVLLLLALIFYFSAQTAADSSATSSSLRDVLYRLLWGRRTDLTPEQQEKLLGIASFLVRKLAHFSEFGALGFFTALHLAAVRALPGSRVKRIWLPAWGFSTLYAVSDELHQFLSEGRAPMVRDALLDSAGAALGACLLLLLHRWSSHRERGNRRS